MPHGGRHHRFSGRQLIVDRTSISKQVRILEDAGLLTSVQHGRETWYDLADPLLRITAAASGTSPPAHSRNFTAARTARNRHRSLRTRTAGILAHRPPPSSIPPPLSPNWTSPCDSSAPEFAGSSRQATLPSSA
ncbi:MAG: hypothetical protein ACKO2P_14875 [Planctomycetota bacterium]